MKKDHLFKEHPELEEIDEHMENLDKSYKGQIVPTKISFVQDNNASKSNQIVVDVLNASDSSTFKGGLNEDAAIYFEPLIFGIYIRIHHLVHQEHHKPRIFQTLPKSPSYITVTKYRADYKYAQIKILTGSLMDDLYKELNNVGKSIVPENAVFNCASSNLKTSWDYDIIVHYSTNSITDRLYELDQAGCTFLFDVKDNLTLNPKPMLDLSSYFK